MQSMKTVRAVFVVAVVAGLPIPQAHAQSAETWVSVNGSDLQNCADPSTPCATLAFALTQTSSGGQINIEDTADFGAVTIDRSVTIVNATSGTASIVGGGTGSPAAQIAVAAGPNDIVTVRGLVLSGDLPAGGSTAGVTVINANRVNIDNCLIQGESVAGIDIIPAAGGQTLATMMNIVIRDSVLSGNNAGMRITSAASLPLNVSVEHSHMDNNLGGGIRIDGSSGGPIAVSVSDSTLNHNAGSGLNAVSSANNVTVTLVRDVIGFNGSAGIQANGTAAGLVVNATSLMNNSVAVSAISGGHIVSYANNSIVGSPGTGFTSTTPLQ